MTPDEAFRLLGLPRTADAKAIQQAWRRAAALHHPDRGGTETYMRDLNVARDLALAAPPLISVPDLDPALQERLRESLRRSEEFLRKSDHRVREYERDIAEARETDARCHAIEAFSRNLTAWLRRHPDQRTALMAALAPYAPSALGYSYAKPGERPAIWARYLQCAAIFERFKKQTGRRRPQGPTIRSPTT